MKVNKFKNDVSFIFSKYFKCKEIVQYQWNHRHTRKNNKNYITHSFKFQIVDTYKKDYTIARLFTFQYLKTDKTATEFFRDGLIENIIFHTGTFKECLLEFEKQLIRLKGIIENEKLLIEFKGATINGNR